LALEDYVKCGLAKRDCQQVWNPYYQMNISFCSYTPIVNAFCLNETIALQDIERGGFISGLKVSTICIGLIVIIWFIGMWLSAIAPLLPWR
jgi:hypothetical protein